MMNKVEKIVEHYIRKHISKAVSEALSNVEEVIEEKVREKLALVQTMNEINQRPRKSLKETEKSLFDVLGADDEVAEAHVVPQRTKITPEALGITEGIWKDIYADTAASANPILNERRTREGVPVPEEGSPELVSEELVSEEALKSMGLFRDYSKHVDAFEERDRKRHVDEDLEAKRREILKSTIRQ